MTDDDLGDVVRTGHFIYESGHHGDTWLDLDALIARPARLADLSRRLAERLRTVVADMVCGPLEGGAFVAHWIAHELHLRFAYASRAVTPDGPRYAVPNGFPIAGQRVILVDDAINVGSAALATARALADRGAEVTAVAGLLLCTPQGAAVGEALEVPQAYLVEIPRTTWTPGDCPHCGT